MNRLRGGAATLTCWIRRHPVLSGLAGLVLLLGLADRLLPPDLSRYRDRSAQVLARDGTLLHAFTTADGKWRLPTDPQAVDPGYLRVLLAAEDHRFRSHHGIDPLALGRALWQLAASGRIVSGGSTLTMQVARLLEPHRRSMLGKLRDAIRAVQLEERFGKDEILSIYLTLAPYGGNLEGVRAASLAWFGHEPNELTSGEAAILVALPQRPAPLRPDRHPAAALAAADRLLARLVAAGRLPADVAETPAPVITGRRAFPAGARHVASRLRSRAGAEGGRIRTTLDAGLQAALEGFAQRQIGWTADGGDLAVVVVDNRDATIRGWIGGVASAMDLARARRSPGSALKPFIYGLAFDDLAILPDTLIEDRPMRFGAWAPEDFDHGFHGQVTARTALQQSLNLPAVELLDRVGAGRLSAALGAAGARLSYPAGTTDPSLPLALGGVGISLQDLTGLYVALARGGRPVALRLVAGPGGPPRQPLLSEHAATLVTGILREAPPPDGRLPPLLVAEGRPIAYKTGTSYGFRDAWAVGYTGDWTVGIWTGRRDGTPRPGFYGRNTAAPLLFDVFDLLPEEGSHERMAAAENRQVAPHLPQALRRFATRAARNSLPGAEPPRILFPPEGGLIDLTGPDGRTGTLALEADGGVLPYRWSVNGVPLPPTPFHAVPHWTPDGPGFARVTVLDGAGRKASVVVRVQ